MKAKSNTKFTMPDDIENVEINMMEYHIVEERNAYLELIKTKAIKYYKKHNALNDDETKYNLKIIGYAINDIEELLEQERKSEEPFGYKYTIDVIELELDLYDTYEEQIKYLKRKIIELDIDTVNIDDYGYDELKYNLEQLIINREKLIKNNDKAGDENEQYPLFNYEFGKIKEYANKLENNSAILYLEYILKEFDREKRENEDLYLSKKDKTYRKDSYPEVFLGNKGVEASLEWIEKGQKKRIDNFEINIKNEIKYIEARTRLETNDKIENRKNELKINKKERGYLPNRIYSKEMFEYTTELNYKGKYNKTVSIEKTLEKFNFSFDKFDSYRVTYGKWLNTKRNNN